MTTRMGWLFAALAAMTSANAFAQEPSATPTPATMESPAATPAPAAAPVDVTTGAMKMKVGGEFFAFWTDNLTKGAKDLNNFDVSRAYLNVLPTFNDKLDARVTTDVTRAAVTGTSTTVSTTGSLVVRLKYGYMTYHLTPEVDTIAGLQQTPWIAYEEDIWPYRGLAPVALETFYGDSSSDFGFTSRMKFLDKKLDIHAGVYNGEFYSKPETNKYKTGSIRASYQILPGDQKTGGLKLHAFYEYGLKAQNADRVRSVEMLSYECPMFTVAGQWLYAQDGSGKPKGHTRGEGESVFAFYNLPWKMPDGSGLRVLARYDIADPNISVSDDGSSRLIAGVALLGSKYSQMVLDYQQTQPQKSGAVTAKAVFVHWLAKF